MNVNLLLKCQLWGKYNPHRIGLTKYIKINSFLVFLMSILQIVYSNNLYCYNPLFSKFVSGPGWFYIESSQYDNIYKTYNNESSVVT